MVEPSTVIPIDGRRARAERGRRAVIEAMVELVVEGHVPPTAGQIAERAGVSTASIFRYFDSLDDLQSEMARRYFEVHADLFVLEAEGEGPLDDRIDRLVKARVRLYHTIFPLARLGRSRAFDNPELDAQLRQSRRGLADQVRRHFATDLAPLRLAERDDLAGLLAAMVSIEAWEHLRELHGRSDAQIARAWRRGLRSLVGPR